MKLIFKINLAVALFTIIAYAAAHISPQYFWYLGFIAYGIPVFMVLNFLFLFFWIFKGNIRLLVSLITIIFGLKNIQASYSLTLNPTQTKNRFSVMSYNVNCFNPYPRKGSKDKAIFKAITDYLEKVSPDILCLQEYCSYPTIKSFDTQTKLLNSTYKHLFYKSRNDDKEFTTAGVAIFTKYPLVGSGTVRNSKEEVMAIYADLIVLNDTIRVYNTHLFSMGLVADKEAAEKASSLKTFIKKMKTGFKAKSEEAVFLKDHLLASPYKTILTGDFNETPYSYIYKSFNAHFNNSFEIAGNGFGITYNGKIPFLRIDHQYADKKVKVLNHRVFKHMNLTDHFPVMVDYTLE